MPTLVQNPNGSLTVSVTFELTGSLLEMENIILDAVNEVGCIGTKEALKRFDTHGMPLIREGINWTSRNKNTKKYQTPFGAVTIKRPVYQTAKGGRIFCPLEESARTVYTATPKFAQQLSHQYSQGNVRAVCRDLKENHHRSIA